MKANQENKKRPAHLQAIIDKLDKNDEEFRALGGDPCWYKKAQEVHKNNPNALIHAAS